MLGRLAMLAASTVATTPYLLGPLRLLEASSAAEAEGPGAAGQGLQGTDSEEGAKVAWWDCSTSTWFGCSSMAGWGGWGHKLATREMGRPAAPSANTKAQGTDSPEGAEVAWKGKGTTASPQHQGWADGG